MFPKLAEHDFHSRRDYGIFLVPHFALINDDNAEFNLRVDHGLHELVRDLGYWTLLLPFL